jgi:hypothetical protein
VMRLAAIWKMENLDGVKLLPPALVDDCVPTPPVGTDGEGVVYAVLVETEGDVVVGVYTAQIAPSLEGPGEGHTVGNSLWHLVCVQSADVVVCNEPAALGVHGTW